MSTTQSNPFAAGVSVFAGVMLLTTCVFQVLMGVAAIMDDAVFVSGPEYIYRLDVTAWGWIHLLLGAVGIAVAIGVLRGSWWGLSAGMGVAVLGALSQFLFLPYYPFWTILVIAMYVVVLWALGNRLTESLASTT